MKLLQTILQSPNYRNATGPSKFFGDAVVRDGFAGHDGRYDCTALQIDGDYKAVGSGTGAVARQDLAWLYPGFPPSCPVNRVRGSVSSSRHLARSMKISFTTHSCTLHDKVYETYPIGVTFVDSS